MTDCFCKRSGTDGHPPRTLEVITAEHEALVDRPQLPLFNQTEAPLAIRLAPDTTTLIGTRGVAA